MGVGRCTGWGGALNLYRCNDPGGGDGCLCAIVTAGDNFWAAGGGHCVANSRGVETNQGIGTGVEAWH